MLVFDDGFLSSSEYQLLAVGILTDRKIAFLLMISHMSFLSTTSVTSRLSSLSLRV